MAAEEPTETDDPPTSPSVPSLAALRGRIAALATTDGRFLVACTRTGVSPVPIDGYRFESRRVAAEAAQYAVAYRWRLRELDPRTPRYDPVVHEASAGAGPEPVRSDGEAAPRDA